MSYNDLHTGDINITREPYGVCLAIPAWNAVGPIVKSRLDSDTGGPGAYPDDAIGPHATARWKHRRAEDLGDHTVDAKSLGRITLRSWITHRMPECGACLTGRCPDYHAGSCCRRASQVRDHINSDLS